jgi:hypothetical protein
MAKHRYTFALTFSEQAKHKAHELGLDIAQLERNVRAYLDDWRYAGTEHESLLPYSGFMVPIIDGEYSADFVVLFMNEASVLLDAVLTVDAVRVTTPDLLDPERAGTPMDAAFPIPATWRRN